MKRLFPLLLLAIALTTAFTACDNGKAETSDTLYPSCKPYTRWWWFAAEIDTNDVRDQLVWLKEHDFGGVEIAWIYPFHLDSTTVHPEFLSPEWGVAVRAAKRMADSLGLGCDFTYGSLWPFNDLHLADGDQTRTYTDSVEAAECRFSWDFPKTTRILNHLDQNAFARYAERLNKAFEKAYAGSKSGLFVDSWEVETMYAWTRGFAETFRAEHGYDIEPYMKSKTLTDEKNIDVYYDYMHTLSGYVMREFYTPFAQNATKVGAFSRAQCGGAPTDLLTAFTLVDIPETEAILYEPPYSKIPASAAALAGKQAVSAETFTCAYGWTGLLKDNGHGKSPHQGREQIADLKLICDALFANGTNQIIWHGFAYNRLGSNANHFYTTCQVSMSDDDNLSGDNLTQFNRYMTTVSQYMRKGKPFSDMAVYMPLEDSWMKVFYPDSVREKMKWVWGQYEMRYIDTPERFKGMQPMWVNKHFLAKAQFKNGRLHCGQMDFAALCVDVEYMELASLRIITALAKQGLPVYVAREPKEPGRNKHPEQYAATLKELLAQPNVGNTPDVVKTKPLLEGDNLPDFWTRREGDTYYIFVANPLTQTITYPLTYCYAFTDRGSDRRITVNHHGKSETLNLHFNPCQSLILKVTPAGVEQINLNYTPPRLRED